MALTCSGGVRRSLLDPRIYEAPFASSSFFFWYFSLLLGFIFFFNPPTPTPLRYPSTPCPDLFLLSASSLVVVVVAVVVAAAPAPFSHLSRRFAFVFFAFSTTRIVLSSLQRRFFFKFRFRPATVRFFFFLYIILGFIRLNYFPFSFPPPLWSLLAAPFSVAWLFYLSLSLSTSFLENFGVFFSFLFSGSSFGTRDPWPFPARTVRFHYAVPDTKEPHQTR